MNDRSKKLWQRLRSHNLIRQISGMMLLTAAGQGLYLLAGPFIGRLYSPEEVGIFGLFVTAWTFLALFGCGLYDLAIPGARDDDEARRLSALSAVLGFGAGAVSGLLITTAAHYDWFGFGILPIWAGMVMFVGMLTHTAVLIGQGWSIRRDQVMRIGEANVVMNGLRSVLQVLGGFLAPLWSVMMIGEIVARVVQARWMARRDEADSSSRFSWNGLIPTMHQNRRFPIVFGPAFLLDSVAMLVQTSMIGVLFGAAEMGQFFLMRRTLDLPVAFAFRSLSDLFLARQIEIARVAPERLQPFFLRASGALAIGAMLAGLPLIIWGPDLFRIFYGANWGVAGTLAAIMVPSFVLNLAVAPVSRVFQISSKAHLRLIPGVINLAGTLLVYWLATSQSWALEHTVIGLSAAISLQFLVYFFAGYFVAGHVRVDSAPESSKSAGPDQPYSAKGG